jgi:CheY-like chemotaxis protein
MPAPNSIKNFFINKLIETDELAVRTEILDVVLKVGKPEYIFELWNYIAKPSGDKTLNVMLEDTLNKLLMANKEFIIKGLIHKSLKVRIFCIPLAGIQKLTKANPILLELLKTSRNSELLQIIIEALGAINSHGVKQDVDSPKINTIKAALISYLSNEDPLVASAVITAFSKIDPDFKIIKAFFPQLDEIPALTVVQILGKNISDKTLDFFSSNIHHKNPVIRRIIHKKLIAQGSNIGDRMVERLINGNNDEQIMAAGVLAKIRDPKKVKFLLKATESAESNVRFVAYEAIGKIRGIGCEKCMKGLFDPELMVRIAVLKILEYNPPMSMHEHLSKEILDKEKKALFVSTMANYPAPSLLGVFYDNENLISEILAQTFMVGNSSIIKTYKKVIKELESARLTLIWKNEEKNQLDKTRSKLRILAIDDSRLVRLHLVNILGTQGYDVITAEHGQHALEIMETNKFDLILTDMNMPVMTGIEFVKNCRELDEYKNIPVCMITTETTKSQKQVAKEAGIDLFLTKPFTEEQLYNIINNLLLLRIQS